MGRFDGRVALVTGAGRGIGAATAKLLSAQGASIVVADMDAGPAEEIAAEIQAAGGHALPVAMDVTSRAQVEETVAKAMERFGRLDILAALAGVTRDNLLFRMTDDDWDQVINTHLKGSFLVSQAVQKQMVTQRYGKIVLTSSTSALGNRGQANYAAAKAGMQGLAKTMAIELGQFNINVNVVAPGFIETRMTRSVAERAGVDYEQMKAFRAAETPLRRVGTPEDVASVIAFLACDESSFVTGQTIYVAGGPRG